MKAEIDQLFLRNTIGISLVELIWGLGIPVVVESTFLQLFLRSLGASNLIIGLAPTFLSSGIALFALMAGYITAPLERKKGAVVMAHFCTSLTILFFGLFLRFTGFGSHTLVVFFFAYGLFSMGIGFTMPIWQNYLMKIFSERKALAALSTMMITQSGAKLLSSILIARLVNRYAFSVQGTSMIFTLVGLCFCSGAFMFLITREFPEKKSLEEHPNRLAYYLGGVREALHNRQFLFFLISDLEFIANRGIIAFYALYATEYCEINPAIAAGYFVACNYLGGLSVNVVFGWFGLFTLKSKLLISKILSLASVVLLTALGATWSFLLASFFLGVSRGTRMLVFPPAVKKLSGMSDATNYFSLAPLLMLPLSVGIPILNGRFLDRFVHLGALSYKYLFLGMGFLILLSILFLLKVDFSAGEKRPQSGIMPRDSDSPLNQRQG